MSAPDFAARQTALRPLLQSHQALLIARPTHVTYLTGFGMLVPEEREAFVVITPHTTYLLHASFSPTPSQSHGLIKKEGVGPNKLAEHLTHIHHAEKINELLVDTQATFVHEWLALLKVSQLTISPAELGTLDLQRSLKDQTEIELITQASQLAAQAWQSLEPTIRSGQTEQQLAQRLDHLMRELGADAPAFPTIVAFGPHSALPHHQPTHTPLSEETAVLIDFGAMVKGYRSDMTRTIWFGRQPAPAFTKISQLVNDAYQQSLQLLRSKKPHWPTAQELDKTSRAVISEAGYGKQYIHTAGHGIGLDIHEPPSLNWTNSAPLQTGMVITVEPGIYLPDQFGYRYENTLALTAEGVQELTL